MPANGKGTVLSLQSRLFLFLTIIVVVPLGVAGFLAQRAVSNLLQERDRNRVTLATPGVLAVYGGRIGTMPDRVSTIAGDADFKRYLVTGDTAGLESLLRRALAKQTGTPLTFAVVADAHHNVIAGVRGQPEYLPGVAPPSSQEMLAMQASPASPQRADSQAIAPSSCRSLVMGSKSMQAVS